MPPEAKGETISSAPDYDDLRDLSLDWEAD